MNDVAIKNPHFKQWERAVLAAFLGLIVNPVTKDLLLRQIQLINMVNRPPRTYQEINFYWKKWFAVRPPWDLAIPHQGTEMIGCRVFGVANVNVQVTLEILIVKGLLFSIEWQHEELNVIREFCISAIVLGEDLMNDRQKT